MKTQLRNTFILLFIIFYLPSSFACRIVLGPSFKNCENYSLVDWSDWNPKNPYLSDPIVPTKLVKIKKDNKDEFIVVMDKAKVLLFEASYELNFPISNLNLENKIRKLDTIKKIESDAKSTLLKKPNITKVDNDTSKYIKLESAIAVNTELTQPKQVQAKLDNAIDLMIIGTLLAEDQEKVLIYDNYYNYIGKNQIKDWLPMLAELDTSISKNPPSEAIIQYLDNFTILGLKGMVITLFYESKKTTRVYHYAILTLKGRWFKIPGATSFLMGESSLAADSIRDIYFKGYKEGIIGGLPNYFRMKVKLVQKGLESLNKN